MNDNYPWCGTFQETDFEYISVIAKSFSQGEVINQENSDHTHIHTLWPPWELQGVIQKFPFICY